MRIVCIPVLKKEECTTSRGKNQIVIWHYAHRESGWRRSECGGRDRELRFGCSGRIASWIEAKSS
jgi:hypothetical protein